VRVVVRRLACVHGRTALPIVADLGFALLVRGASLEGSPPAGKSSQGAGLAQLFRELLAVQGFEADLDAALGASDAWRERFQRVAYTGLMLLRNPIGHRRRVGGRMWAQRRLFDQVQAHDPDFVLLRQAAREVRADLCDAQAAGDYVRRLP